MKKTNIRVFVNVVVLALSVVAFPRYLGAQAAPQSVTITGDVEMEEEDDQGNVVKIRLSYLNDRYEIEALSIDLTGKGRELLKGVGRSVKVTGTKANDADGNQVLKVTAYEYLPVEKVKEETLDEDPGGSGPSE
jgi:hypothetical protein